MDILVNIFVNDLPSPLNIVIRGKNMTVHCTDPSVIVEDQSLQEFMIKVLRKHHPECLWSDP